jgi:hypothetical protein
VTRADQEVSKPLRREGDRGVVADITVAPKDILTGRRIVVQARHLPEKSEIWKGGIERRDE